MSCPGAGSVDVTGGTSRHLSTPKRLARVARLLPRPSRRSWRPDPAATHVSALSEVLGPLPVHASVDSPKPRRQAALRPFSEVRRREPAVVCQQPPVVGSTARWSPTVTTTQSTRLSEPWHCATALGGGSERRRGRMQSCAERRSTTIGVIQMSPMQSQRDTRTKKESDRGEMCRLALEQRRCFCPIPVARPPVARPLLWCLRHPSAWLALDASSWAVERWRAPCSGESPGGIAPPGARRTGHEPLSSSGSHRPAVGARAEPPVCEQAWLSSEDGGQGPACFGGVAAQPLVFPRRPSDEVFVDPSE